MQRISKALIPFVIVSVFALPGFLIFAQQGENLTPTEERDLLEQELKQLEDQIKGIEGDITKTQKEKDTLKNQIAVLRNKIKKLNLQVEQSNKIIVDLRSQISDTTSSIDKTTGDIEGLKDEMAAVLQRVYREDQRSKVEIVLASSTLSDFFNDMAQLVFLNAQLEELLGDMKELHGYLETQKDALVDEKGEEENFVKIQLLQKQENQNIQVQTEQLLVQTQGKEVEYQRLLADKKQRAQQIRSRIFDLIGVPDAPTFGEAVLIAKGVAVQTGVRPALLLAVLTQESNLGKNVGQCYLNNTATGAGVSVKGTPFSNVMKPTRDVQPFLTITKDLGRDPFQTPVSCPIPSVGGYGGAMGPAQFIPSTWMGYKKRLDAILARPADPWNIRDAFLASGLYLGDSGATDHSYNAEWCAAQRYFSGRCSTSYRFYGDSVMSLAARYEKDIQTLDEVNGI
ncbi:MAG TPA: lytic murein transglycosylase [Candidatus Paceibacterota bacterium]|nr:lytic murein transglycosylase [Candidatus Paceibacterota bacterium]